MNLQYAPGHSHDPGILCIHVEQGKCNLGGIGKKETKTGEVSLPCEDIIRDKFENLKRKLFGQDGYENGVEQVAGREKRREYMCH
jgi:hypothetical protein